MISKDGINGTVGGSLNQVKRFIRVMKDFAPFKDIQYKWSEGNGDEFPRLQVRVRDEIKMTVQAYQTLYESSIAYGMRKALQAE